MVEKKGFRNRSHTNCPREAPMPYVPLLSPWQKSQAKKLLSEGVPAVTVARKYGISPQLMNYYKHKWEAESKNESICG